MNPRRCILPTCDWTRPPTSTSGPLIDRIHDTVMGSLGTLTHFGDHPVREFADELLRLDPGPVVRRFRTGDHITFACPVRYCDWERTVDTREHGFWWSLLVGDPIQRVEVGYTIRTAHVRAHTRGHLVGELLARTAPDRTQ